MDFVNDVVSRETFRILTLSKLRGIGIVALNRLLLEAERTHTDPMLVAEKSPGLVTTLQEGNTRTFAERSAERDVIAAGDLGITILSPVDENYPAALRVVPDRPPLLFVKGSMAVFKQRAVAIVGTREPTDHGKVIARRIAEHFAREGWCIVSGLALGTDGIAQRAVTRIGHTTVAVMAHGLQMVAPKSHSQLAAEILECGGALISEYAPEVKPFTSQFIRRDRVQAGLSLGLILIQTGIKGGSLHASRAILEYGRPLGYPVPTPKDVARREPKIEGVLRIHNEPRPVVAEYLGCSEERLRLLVPLHTKRDYSSFADQVLRATREVPLDSDLDLFGRSP